MKLLIASVFIIVGFSLPGYTQPVNGPVVYFNENFQSEIDYRPIRYYGIPQKIKRKLYVITFYSLDSQKVAMGEFNSKRFRKRNGVFAVFNYEGKIILATNYRKGLLHGSYQKFHNNGKLSDSGRLKFGFPIGTWKSWYSNGQLKEIRNHELGRGFRGMQFSVLTKEFRSYYPDGNADDSGYYQNNLKDGIWVEWEENGRVRSIGEYKNGWKKGMWKYYDPNGKLLYLRRFRSLKYDKVGERIDLK